MRCRHSSNAETRMVLFLFHGDAARPALHVCAYEADMTSHQGPRSCYDVSNL